MIQTEDLGMVIRTYSSEGKKIRQVESDTLWNDAVDIKPVRYTYEETDEPIDDEELDPQEALDILMGGNNG